ncbi:MAG: lamin tail domain-containing protein [Patescibacteria group bacterium]|nr:lamin tail domain-containing protein [Patescibacteria group bacterium]
MNNFLIKKYNISRLCLVLLGVFVFLFLFSFNIGAKELTQEEIDKYIQLPKEDIRDILHSLPEPLTIQWMDSVISTSDSEKEAIVIITRQAIRGKMMDYFLREGPKELGKEVIKMAFLVGKLVMTTDVSALFVEFEKITVKESLKYLGQWLKENETKIGFGDIDFSYNTILKNKEKHNFQYIIIYSPSTKETVIKIYSVNPMTPPASKGSVGGLSGTSWNYSKEQAKGKKISSFILSIKGKMSRKQSGYRSGKIIHDYSWDYQPKIDIEFSDFVPFFNLNRKGFFERTGDKIQGFFSKFNNKFSNFFGASIAQPTFNDSPEPLPEFQGNDKQLGELIKKILEQIKFLKQFLSDSGSKQLEQEAKDMKTEEDFIALLKKLENAQDKIKEMEEFIEKDNNNREQEEEELPEVISEKDDKENLSKAIKSEILSIIINEVCVGLDNSKNEFIEIYNPSDTDVLIHNDNFQIELVDSNNKSTKKKVNWSNNIIPAHGHFLLTSGELIINNKELESDANFSSQLSSVSGVIISDKNGNILDRVGWGSTTKSAPVLAIETRGKILNNGLKTGESIERSEYIDTENNFEDFILNESPSPTNSKGDKQIYTKSLGGGGGSSNVSGNGSNDSNNNENSGELEEINYCSKENLNSSAYSPVIFNEIAWMGSDNSANDEWIELKNISTSTISLSGWQILDRDEQIKIILGENEDIFANDFYLLERTDDDSVPGVVSDKIYTGGLNNTNELLYLFNSDCVLIDRIVADPDWIAGNNDEKRTMERGDDLSWYTNNGASNNGIKGTPRAENSENNELDVSGEERGQEEETGEGIDSSLVNQLVITEIRADGVEEFIEIYNPFDQDISLSGLYLSYFSEGRDWNDPYINKQFPTSTIASDGYYLIGFGDYNGEPATDWSPDTRHLSDNIGSVGIFSCNPKNSEDNHKNIEEAKECKIDVLGWGATIVKEGQVIDSVEEDKSFARKLQPDNSGYLRYIDTDNNSIDFEEQESTPRTQNYSVYSDLDNDRIIDSLDPLTLISMDVEIEPGEYIFKDLLITNKANLFLKTDPDLEEFKGIKILAENLTIEADCSLNSDQQGYPELIISDKNYFFPQTLGSGGPESSEIPGQCGAILAGAGGGAIILEVSNILEIQGRISVIAENGSPSPSWGCPPTAGGEGGSIQISTNILQGHGNIFADGGDGGRNLLSGRGGQIAIYYQDKQGFNGLVHAFGGEKGGSYASPGTVYFENSSQKSFIIKAQNKEAIFDLQNNLMDLGTIKVVNVTVRVETDINIETQNIILESALLKGPDQLFINFKCSDFFLVNSGIRANIDVVAQNFSLDQESFISADGKGYPSDTGPGTGIGGVGGSYGGIGRKNTENSIYGNLLEPTDFGSGGGGSLAIPGSCSFRPAGAGGGAIILNIQDKLNLNGMILANGDGGSPSPDQSCRPAPSYGCSPTAGGSGGSAYIRSNILEGYGTINSNGGGSCYRASAGGGGRIAVYGDRNSFTGSIQSLGGENPAYDGVYNGQDGTVYLSSQ